VTLRKLSGGFTSDILQNLLYRAFFRRYYRIMLVQNSFHTGWANSSQNGLVEVMTIGEIDLLTLNRLHILTLTVYLRYF